MKLACKLFGHKWNFCTCERCRAKRSGSCYIVHPEGSCFKRCQVCGSKWPVHDWNACTCRRCGAIDESSHQFQWVFEDGYQTGICAICGQVLSPASPAKPVEYVDPEDAFQRFCAADGV